MDKLLKISPILNLGLVGLVACLFIWIFNLKDSNADKTQKINTLEWLNAAKQAENDTLKAIGQYAIPDTIRDSIPVPYPVYDTTTGDSVMAYRKVPWLKLVGSIEIDTVAKLGSESNPLYVRVKGMFYYPPEYGPKNWLLVYPDKGKPPYLPVTPRSRGKWGIGLTCAMSLDGTGRIGGFVRSGRTSLGLYWTPDRKQWMAGLSYEIFGVGFP